MSIKRQFKVHTQKSQLLGASIDRLSAPDVPNNGSFLRDTLAGPQEAPECRLVTRTLRLAVPKRADA